MMKGFYQCRCADLNREDRSFQLVSPRNYTPEKEQSKKIGNWCFGYSGCCNINKILNERIYHQSSIFILGDEMRQRSQGSDLKMKLKSIDRMEYRQLRINVVCDVNREFGSESLDR